MRFVKCLILSFSELFVVASVFGGVLKTHPVPYHFVFMPLADSFTINTKNYSKKQVLVTSIFL